jgi:hypothetical protein
MNPANPINIIIAAIYYITVVVLALLSIFSVYVLMRYGRNRLLGSIVCVFYALFFLTLLQQSHLALMALQ